MIYFVQGQTAACSTSNTHIADIKYVFDLYGITCQLQAVGSRQRPELRQTPVLRCRPWAWNDILKCSIVQSWDQGTSTDVIGATSNHVRCRTRRLLQSKIRIKFNWVHHEFTILMLLGVCTWFNGVGDINEDIVTIVCRRWSRCIDDHVREERFATNHFTWKINAKNRNQFQYCYPPSANSISRNTHRRTTWSVFKSSTNILGGHVTS